MKPDPSQRIQDYLVFGEFGGVNPSITDSSTYTFLNADRLEDAFEKEMPGCYLYSRHMNPIGMYLEGALAKLENTESAHVTSSGMAAISCTLMQLCGAGDEIVSGRTIYGGSYALFKNVFPRLGITVRFVDITNPEEVKTACNSNTRAIYCEAVSNPLLEVADLPMLAEIAHERNIQLVVDNTFTPMIISPHDLGADIVVHSMTKFINGTSDCVAGAICASKSFTDSLLDVQSGVAMLLGPVLDSFRSSSILKNLHSLHLRMKKHSENARLLAEQLEAIGVKIHYPGLPTHPGHELLKSLMNDDFGFGGMLTFDVGTHDKANRLMNMMQDEKVGYLAVSLGYYKTLFSSPGHSTSSEIPLGDQEKMGLSDGLIRMSVGLDNHISTSFHRIKKCLAELELL